MGRCAKALLDPDTGLTPKEKAFAEEVARTGNLSKAAKVYQTKYPAAVGCQVFARPAVRAAVMAAFHRKKITPDYVLRGFHFYAEKGKVDYRWAAPGVSALDRIGRFLGMFKEEGGGDRLSLTFNVLNLNAPELEGRVQLLTERLAALGSVPTLAVKSNGPPKVSLGERVRLTTSQTRKKAKFEEEGNIMDFIGTQEKQQATGSERRSVAVATPSKTPRAMTIQCNLPRFFRTISRKSVNESKVS